MIMQRHMSASRRSGDAGSSGFFRLLPPFPVFVLQPLLQRIAGRVATQHPELFARLGDNCKKRFLIDPINLPVFLLLEPLPQRPRLTAYNRGTEIVHDVVISATFSTFLQMIDSQTDSDALFFSRDLKVSGDTEAIVALRNALDNMDETLADDVLASFGPLSGPARAIFDFAGTRKGSHP